MTHDESYDKLQDYLDGNLPTQDIEEIEQWIGKDSDLADLCEEMKRIDSLLKCQETVTPSAHFTQSVFEKAGIPEPRTEVAMERIMERATVWAPLATLVLVTVFYGKTILVHLLNLWTSLGSWLETETGVGIVKSDPLLSLCSVILLAGVVVTYIFLTRRSRASV